MYNVSLIRENVRQFNIDKDALCSYWNYEYEQMQMLDTSQQLYNAINRLKKQGCNNIFIVDKSNFDVIVLQPKEINSIPHLPDADILALGIGYVVPGFAFIVKKECWYCRKTENIERCLKCNMTNHCSIICKEKHICRLNK